MSNSKLASQPASRSLIHCLFENLDNCACNFRRDPFHICPGTRKFILVSKIINKLPLCIIDSFNQTRPDRFSVIEEGGVGGCQLKQGDFSSSKGDRGVLRNGGGEPKVLYGFHGVGESIFHQNLYLMVLMELARAACIEYRPPYSSFAFFG